MKIVILLTACVNPNGMAFTKIQDYQIRLDQYKKALKWYLDNTYEKIVFVENTMCDFSNEFSEYINSGRLEYITFNGNCYDRALGKGYGEAIIIKTALNKSKFLSLSDNLIKITGRLIIWNIYNIIVAVKSTNILYANSSIVNGHALCHSTVFIAPKAFLKDYFIKGINFLNDSKGYYFEHLLYDSMIKWKMNGGIHFDFKLPLLIDGVSGSTGERYLKSNRCVRMKSYIKYVAHRYGIYRNHFKSDSTF